MTSSGEAPTSDEMIRLAREAARAAAPADSPSTGPVSTPRRRGGPVPSFRRPTSPRRGELAPSRVPRSGAKSTGVVAALVVALAVGGIVIAILFATATP